MSFINTSAASEEVPGCGRHGSRIHPDLEQMLIEAHQNADLTTLDLSLFQYNNAQTQERGVHLDKADAECIVCFLKNTSRFVKLEMNCFWLAPEALRVLGTYLRDTRQIEVLGFRGRTETDSGEENTFRCSSIPWMTSMAADLETNKSVEQVCWTNFDFSGNLVEYQTMYALFMRSLSHRIKKLKIYKCTFGMDINFFTRGQGLLSSSLQDFALFQCHFPEDAKGAKLLVSVATQCPMIKRLSLCWNSGLGQQTLFALTTRWVQVPNGPLVTLLLNHNKGLLEDSTAITDAFCQALKFSNNSLLNIQIFPFPENRAPLLYLVRIRNFYTSLVRRTLLDPKPLSLAAWGRAFHALSLPDSDDPTKLAAVSGLFLALTRLSPGLSEQHQREHDPARNVA